MTKNEKKIYDKVGNQLKAREIITRRRWLIFLAIVAVIVAVIITWLGLWIIVFYLFNGYLMIAGFLALIDWLIDWLCGEDVNPYGRRGQPSPHGDDENHESTSDTLWNLWFLDHWINHGK